MIVEWKKNYNLNREDNCKGEWTLFLVISKQNPMPIIKINPTKRNGSDWE